MKSGLFKIETNHIQPAKGKILISEPFLPGSYFNRSVILLVSHSDNGSVGFILNKKNDYSVSQVVDGFPDISIDLYLGGPVSTDSVYFIHTLGKLIPGSIQVKDGLYWGGDFQVLQDKIRNGEILPSQVCFFLGYSGWDKGQLEEELRDNGWLVSDIDQQTLMDKPFSGKQMWLKTIRQLGGRYSIWENFPENPSLN